MAIPHNLSPLTLPVPWALLLGYVPRPLLQLTSTVGTNVFHVSRTVRTERTFVGTDIRSTIGVDIRVTLLAPLAHFECH